MASPSLPVIKSVPEDFIVEEIPSYEPSGDGAHLFLWIEKRDLGTPFAAKKIADALGVPVRDMGIAGRKDRRAVTRQWVSVPYVHGREEAAMALSVEGLNVLVAKRHFNKLKTGHLRANRFAIRVRGLDEAGIAAAIERVHSLEQAGVPNRFGEQRFGREKENAVRARRWIKGDIQPPRDLDARRFEWSALQSELFNEVLKRRVEAGTWRTCLLGDLVKKTDTGGIFDCTDEAEVAARAARNEVVPTGPMFGATMRNPTGIPLTIEQAVIAEAFPKGLDLGKLKRLGEGTRRPLAFFPTEVRAVREEDGALGVYFVLPTGAYATTLLEVVLPGGYRSAESSEAEGPPPSAAASAPPPDLLPAGAVPASQASAPRLNDLDPPGAPQGNE